MRLHEKGLVYRGSYMVNWSPNLQTAVSDLEVGLETYPCTAVVGAVHVMLMEFPLRITFTVRGMSRLCLIMLGLPALA